MGKKVYTKEMKDWLVENVPGNYWMDIQKLFNQKFETNLSRKALKATAARINVKTNKRGIPKNYKRMLSEEEVKIFTKNNKGKTAKEMQQFCLEIMGREFTVMQIKGIRCRLHLDSGLTGHFVKGRIPPNKGKKMSEEKKEKIRHTFFKKGNIPHNAKNIGDERIVKDGYIQVKVYEDRKHHNWVAKSNIIWNEAYPDDPVEKGEVVIFLDGDIYNFNISNLRKITKAENCYMNHVFRTPNNAELREAELAIAKLKLKVKEKTK